MLEGKKILLGICGSIAAYKAAYLTRLLVKANAMVKVVMTPDSMGFVQPLTFSTLSKNPVLTQFTNDENGLWNNHVDLAEWADLIIIAPATANTLAKMANGICDNLLMAVLLSARSPVAVAPAMDLDMYGHPATQRNMDQLKKDGIHIIAAETGELASGLSGEGRMAEPENIISNIISTFFLSNSDRLKGVTVTINAGPTQESIDPVRYISNHSTGKMGISLAEQLTLQGAQVNLVLGPTDLKPSIPGINTLHVTTADEMFSQSTKLFPQSDIFIGSAAVADFTPSHTANRKIKKENGKIPLELIATKDILKELGTHKKPGQVLVGFALETHDEKINAAKKLESKNLDFIILNSLKEKGAGFGVNTNKISILSKNNKTLNFELKPKPEVARDIVEYLIEYIDA